MHFTAAHTLAMTTGLLYDADLVKNLSYDYLKMNGWVPLKREGSVIHVLMSDPHDVEKGFDIRRAFPGLHDSNFGWTVWRY